MRLADAQPLRGLPGFQNRLDPLPTDIEVGEKVFVGLRPTRTRDDHEELAVVRWNSGPRAPILFRLEPRAPLREIFQPVPTRVREENGNTESSAALAGGAGRRGGTERTASGGAWMVKVASVAEAGGIERGS